MPSTLFVHIKSADIRQPKEFNPPDPYVIGKIEGQRAETSFRDSTFSPVWNENF